MKNLSTSLVKKENNKDLEKFNSNIDKIFCTLEKAEYLEFSKSHKNEITQFKAAFEELSLLINGEAKDLISEDFIGKLTIKFLNTILPFVNRKINKKIQSFSKK